MEIHDAMVNSAGINAGTASGQKPDSSKYDRMVERIQGQIQSVNVKIQVVDEDKRLSLDEKKRKIKKLNEELEGHRAALSGAKADQTAERITESSKEMQNNPVDRTSVTKISCDGDTLGVSKTALLRADHIFRMKPTEKGEPFS